MVTQRAYRAACPNCGAPVEFASAASASAVCGFCRSTLVREGEALRRIGASSELFDDHSPLQLGASGHYKGLAFTLVGRLQIGWTSGPRAATSPASPPTGAAGRTGQAGSGLDGSWNEWHALFDSGRSGWLSEDNGAYVFAFDSAWPADAPADAAAAARLTVGRPLAVDARPWTLASIVQARLLAAQGELPSPPRLEGEYLVAELRNAQDEVGTLDYSDVRQPQWSIGRPVLLAELGLRGLAAESTQTLAGRSIECPGCGAALALTLASTKSIACAQCHTVTDVSQGVGAELEHYAQNNSGAGGLMPLIPMGASGTLRLGTAEAVPWQVVGYLERCDLPAPAAGNDEDEDEQAFWREYLLYNREHGFAFLVDSEEDGWSWVRPITGTPSGTAERPLWRGVSYKKGYTYRAQVTWVLGEFYWRVRRGETAEVSDYAGIGKASASRLSREQSAGEVVWSAGQTIDAALIAKAFGVRDPGTLQRDRLPVAGGSPKKAIERVIAAIVVLMLASSMLETCGGDDCDDVRRAFGASSNEYQQCQRTAGSGSTRIGGGSFGGFSSGGGHK